MNSCPHLKLSRLRDIGWSKWDPIGLLHAGDTWDKHPDFTDEYDRYLRHVATRLRNGWSVSDAVEYLILVENEQMGLRAAHASLARDRAEATANAIKAYLDELAGE